MWLRLYLDTSAVEPDTAVGVTTAGVCVGVDPFMLMLSTRDLRLRMVEALMDDIGVGLTGDGGLLPTT